MSNSIQIAKYREAVKELLFLDPTMGSIARSMGTPVFDHKEQTAYITWDKNKKICFGINPDFLMELDLEKAAAVIAHEAYHLALMHLDERTDNITFPIQQNLVIAQECIINDTIKHVHHMKMPDGVYYGMDVIQEDCSQYTSKQVYDKLPKTKYNDLNFESIVCGGIIIDSQDIQEFMNAVDKVFEDAAKDSGKSIDEFKEEILNSNGGGYAMGLRDGTQDGSISTERMNWRKLLAKINPKVLDSGGKKKTQNNWMKPNRRMISGYPNVVLPTIELKSKDTKKGDSIPSLVIALDLSGSIPHDLVNTLQGMLDEIPKDLINAYPCTWSSTLVPYDPVARIICHSMFTEIKLVTNYVKDIQLKTRTNPYVVVITDGEFDEGFEQPGNDWYFMAINKFCVESCSVHAKTPDYVYCIDDFRIHV